MHHAYDKASKAVQNHIVRHFGLGNWPLDEKHLGLETRTTFLLVDYGLGLVLNALVHCISVRETKAGVRKLLA